MKQLLVARTGRLVGIVAAVFLAAVLAYISSEVQDFTLLLLMGRVFTVSSLWRCWSSQATPAATTRCTGSLHAMSNL